MSKWYIVITINEIITVQNTTYPPYQQTMSFSLSHPFPPPFSRTFRIAEPISVSTISSAIQNWFTRLSFHLMNGSLYLVVFLQYEINKFSLWSCPFNYQNLLALNSRGEYNQNSMELMEHELYIFINIITKNVAISWFQF